MAQMTTKSHNSIIPVLVPDEFNIILWTTTEEFEDIPKTLGYPENRYILIWPELCGIRFDMDKVLL